MKAQEHRSEGLQHTRLEADLEERIDALFCHWPILCGFSVEDYPVTNVSVYPLSGLQAPEELCVEIVMTLSELIDECPEAIELLSERSFARTFH